MKRPSDEVKVLSDNRAAMWRRVSKIDWLTADEASVYVRFGLPAFEKMVKEFAIPFSRPAGPRGDRRFFRPDLDKFMHSRREPAA